LYNISIGIHMRYMQGNLLSCILLFNTIDSQLSDGALTLLR